MGATSKTVLKITCDNPACPGTDLPSDKSYDGWYRVTVETQQTPATTKDEPAPMVFPARIEKVYCSPACAATIEEAIVEQEAARGNDQQN